MNISIILGIILVILIIAFIIFLIIKKFSKHGEVKGSLFGGTPSYFVKAFFEGSGLFSFIKSKHLRKKLQDFEEEKQREELLKKEQQKGLLRMGEGGTGTNFKGEIGTNLKEGVGSDDESTKESAEKSDKSAKELAETNEKLTREVRKELKAGKKSVKKKFKKGSKGGRAKAKSGIGKRGDKVIIKITNFEQLLKMVNDKKVAEILQYLKKKDYIFIKKRILNRNFESEKEFNQFLREEVANFLKGWHDDLKGRTSDLRKSGKDIGTMGFKLMSIPLKIRLFEASFYKKDFDKVVTMLEKMQESLENYEAKYVNKEKPEPEETKEVPKSGVKPAEEEPAEKPKQAKPELKKTKVKKAVKKPKKKK